MWDNDHYKELDQLSARLQARGLKVPNFDDPTSLSTCLDAIQSLTRTAMESSRRRLHKRRRGQQRGLQGLGEKISRTSSSAPSALSVGRQGSQPDMKDLKIRLRFYEKECEKVQIKVDSLEARLAPRLEFWEGLKGEGEEMEPLVVLKRIKRTAEMALGEGSRAKALRTNRPLLPPFSDDPEEEASRLLRRKGLL